MQMKDPDVSQMKIDNLYDMLFDSFGNPKLTQNLSKKALISDSRVPMSILENQGRSIKFEELGRTAVDLSKIKVNKSFKAVNAIPRFQSVPATPYLFDLAGDSVDYPDLTEEKAKFGVVAQKVEEQVSSGIMGAIGSFFGRR